MTPKEAIEILQDEHDWAQLLSYVKAAIKLAISALEKQTSRKPQVEIVSFDYGTTIEKCPCCEHPYVTKDNNYCSKCGQKLDWGDEE